MPYILDAVRASATVGEICEALRGGFGLYQEEDFFIASTLVLEGAANPDLAVKPALDGIDRHL